MNSEMKIPREVKRVKALSPCNAYRVKPETEYNLGTRSRRLTESKMYAELARKRKCKSQRIKSLWGNKLGFSSLMFNGIPVISDTNVPSYHMFFLNENHLHLLAHKNENIRLTEFDEPINQNIKDG